MGSEVGAIRPEISSIGYSSAKPTGRSTVGYAAPKESNQGLVARLDAIDARVHRPSYSGGGPVAQRVDYLS